MDELENKDGNNSEDFQPGQTDPSGDPGTDTTSTKSKEKTTTRSSTRDYDAELAQKDLEIKEVTEKWQAAKNDHHLTKGEIQKARSIMAEAVAERDRIVAEKEAALESTQKELETQSQATQTLSKEKTELNGELELAAAKATKLEILTEEFPELLRYAKLINPSRDPEAVREACRVLAEARKQDLESLRINAVTGNNISQLSSNATRNEPRLADTTQMREYLVDAKTDAKEYERRRQTLIDQFNASVGQINN